MEEEDDDDEVEDDGDEEAALLVVVDDDANFPVTPEAVTVDESVEEAESSTT